MLGESEICSLLSALLPSGREQACFESDAERFQFQGHAALLSTDEYSAEDHFPEHNPEQLGWNIAVATLSDILACGGRPMFYAHALTVDPRWDHRFLKAFGLGLRNALVQSGTRFLGGDVGRSAEWRCTGIALGTPSHGRLSRMGALEGDRIYLTGAAGLGNAYAAQSLHPGRRGGPELPPLPLRTRATPLVRRYATACIDTSDGVCSAAHTLADLNRLGFRLRNIPRLPAATACLEALSLPGVLLLLGGCGEYELLFTVRPENERDLHLDARQLEVPVACIGEMTATGRILEDIEGVMDLARCHIEARDFPNLEAYLEALLGAVSASGLGRGAKPSALHAS